jgi:polyisoprenyl-phosphate glycosyltransferase
MHIIATDYVFIIPVFNDWESVQKLQQKIELLFANKKDLLFLIVNDSSEDPMPHETYVSLKSKTLILELSRNMGHQKAIATGLSYAHDHFQASAVIVMDSDGEDRPEDIESLMKEAMEYDRIVFAKRSKRSEGWLFVQFYHLYRFLFLLLTGKTISFGNYCVIPHRFLRKIVHVPDIWNHFSGGIIRSGVPYTSIPTVRGKRYFGESKMNFTRLVLHGLSAVSVYADFMAIRLIIFSFVLILLTITGILSVACIRLFTHMAIPGWATITVLSLGILLFLALLLGLFLLFNVLAMKTQKNIIPAKDYKDFVFEVHIITAHG